MLIKGRLVIAPEFYTTMREMCTGYAEYAGALLHDETVKALTKKRWHGKPRWFDRKPASASGETPRSETGRLVESLRLQHETRGFLSSVALRAGRLTKEGRGLLWPLLEYGGQRVYIIRPVRAKHLVFHQWDTTLGKFVLRFAKYVIHPPLAPRPFRGVILDNVVKEMTKRRRRRRV